MDEPHELADAREGILADVRACQARGLPLSADARTIGSGGGADVSSNCNQVTDWGSLVVDTQQELEVVRTLLRLREISFDDSAIQQRQPPQMDVECDPTSKGVLHFEVTEAFDEDLAAAAHDATEGLSRALNEAYSAADRTLQDQLDARLGDALVNVTRLVYGKRPADSASQILGRLARVDAQFQGRLDLAEDKLGELVSVDIVRGDIAGPLFDSARVVLSDVPWSYVVNAIEKKASKRYASGGELVVFFDRQHVPGNWTLPAEARDTCIAALTKSQFTEAWIVKHRHPRKILAHLPVCAATE